MREFSSQLACEAARVETPPPIAAMQAGSIHPRLAAESQDVLQRDDAQTRGGTLGRANERPMDAILAPSDIGLSVAAFVFRRAGMPPSSDGVVVMGTGVDDFARSEERRVGKESRSRCTPY